VRDDLLRLEPTIASRHIKHERQAASFGTSLFCDLLAILVLMLRALDIAVQLHYSPHVVLNALSLHMICQIVFDSAAQQLPGRRFLVHGFPNKTPQFFLLLVVLEGTPQRAP
jgi:hypothetical protein